MLLCKRLNFLVENILQKPQKGVLLSELLFICPPVGSERDINPSTLQHEKSIYWIYICWKTHGSYDSYIYSHVMTINQKSYLHWWTLGWRWGGKPPALPPYAHVLVDDAVERGCKGSRNSTTSISAPMTVSMEEIGVGINPDYSPLVYSMLFHHTYASLILSLIPKQKLSLLQICLLYTSPSPRD